MSTNPFSHVTHWVFDLDHTLYPPSNNLFAQIEVKMVEFMVEELGLTKETANELRQRYWKAYGTTLAGLMREYDIDADKFLYDVHQIDFSVISPDPELADAIAALPGRKFIYTNGTALYARDVIAALHIPNFFDGIYGVEDANYIPKPEAEAFDIVFSKADVPPKKAAMFEDDIRNLVVPKSLGLKTVLVGPKPKEPADHIDVVTQDLSARFCGRSSDIWGEF